MVIMRALVLFLTLMESFSFFPFNLMLAANLMHIAFIMFRYVPCISDLSMTFIMKGCLILSKAFSVSKEIILWHFFFQFVYMVDNIDRFSCVESSLHLWDEADLIMVDDFFMCSWI